MVSAQDKLIAVANRLGLDTLQYMQGSTGAIYDTDTDRNGIIFGNANRHRYVLDTNLNDNKFEVNEALLIETIAFSATLNTGDLYPLWKAYGQQSMLVFDLVIGNKTVMKDTPVFFSGAPYAFASAGFETYNSPSGTDLQFKPRTQIYMEGAGIVIPPQVDFQLNYKIFNVVSGELVEISQPVQAYLFGTKVNLNFNTTL
jgi:hypothetical protein